MPTPSVSSLPNDLEAAVFDVDHTLIRGTSGETFGRWLWKRRRLGLRRSEFLGAVLRYRLGLGSAERIVALGALSGRGHPLAEIEQLARQCVAQVLLRQLQPPAVAEVEAHLAAGRRVVLASGSPQTVVAALAAHLGAQRGIGATASLDDGGRLGTTPCEPLPYGPGKAQLVRDELTAHGIDPARTAAYSDSASDIPLLELVSWPVAVDPSPTLARTAQQRGWPVVRWRA